MPKKIEVYECEHCNKNSYKHKSSCITHEKRCFWNPETKSCMTCFNYIGGGHYAHQCNLHFMNTGEKLKIDRIIKELKHHCEHYKSDGLTIEERKEQVNTLNSDAQSDHDDYNANRM